MLRHYYGKSAQILRPRIGLMIDSLYIQYGVFFKVSKTTNTILMGTSNRHHLGFSEYPQVPRELRFQAFKVN